VSLGFGTRLAAARLSAHSVAGMAALEEGLALMMAANGVVSKGMASQWTLVPTRQGPTTLSSASAADVLPVIRCRDLCEVAVVLAADWQPIGKAVRKNLRILRFVLLSRSDRKNFAPKL
jgi:hypothetical protein